jgi:hypothetical protein
LFSNHRRLVYSIFRIIVGGLCASCCCGIVGFSRAPSQQALAGQPLSFSCPAYHPVPAQNSTHLPVVTVGSEPTYLYPCGGHHLHQQRTYSSNVSPPNNHSEPVKVEADRLRREVACLRAEVDRSRQHQGAPPLQAYQVDTPCSAPRSLLT